MKIAVAIAVLAALTPRAHADDKKTQADQLFDEGVALREKGMFKEACQKFDEAMKRDERAVGTILNLALCAEKFEKYASAVKLYSEARDRAHEQGLTEHEKAAIDHIGVLAPQVSHLTITLAEALPSTKVLVDDTVVPVADLTKYPIDAGERAIVVSAPGRLPYETKVTIAIGKDAALAVPALGQAVTVSSRKTIGKIVAISGGVLFVASIGLGAWGKSSYDHQFDIGACDHATNRCTPAGNTATSRARTIGNTGTVVGAIGIAAAGVGVWLWLTAPTAEAPTANHVAFVPTATPDQIGFAAVGRF